MSRDLTYIVGNLNMKLPIQMPRMLESAVNSVINSTTTMNRREEDDGTRWEPNAVTTGVSLDELVPTSTVKHLQYCIISLYTNIFNHIYCYSLSTSFKNISILAAGRHSFSREGAARGPSLERAIWAEEETTRFEATASRFSSGLRFYGDWQILPIGVLREHGGRDRQRRRRRRRRRCK